MEFDPRLTELGIKVTETPNAKWKVTAVRYQNDQESGGKHHILFFPRDASNKPAPGVACVVDWPGRDDPQPFKAISDANGEANFPMYANLNPELKNGPYFAYLEAESASDIVRGMGLPVKHHVNFLITFAPATAVAPPAQNIDQALIAEAKKYRWMPINTGASLYKFAEKNNLGYPQTDEFEFVFGGDGYIGQVYNGGIVYVKKGDWGNVKSVKKPA